MPICYLYISVDFRTTLFELREDELIYILV